MESQLDGEEVSSARLEWRVKIARNFDPTVGSRLNFCKIFRKPFSLGLLWNRKSVMRRPPRQDLSNGSKRP